MAVMVSTVDVFPLSALQPDCSPSVMSSA